MQNQPTTTVRSEINASDGGHVNIHSHQVAHTIVNNRPHEPAPPANINTLPTKNPYFEGRSARLADIENKFKNNKAVVVHGPGGIGKTSLVYYYAHQLPEDKARVKIRIRAENLDTLKSDYQQLAKQLSISPNQELNDLVDEVNAKLIAVYPNGIIVFDNVPDYKKVFNEVRSENVGQTLTRFFPKNNKFHIIVTTRNQLHWPAGAGIPVNILGSEDAFKLFEKISGREFKNTNDERLLNHFLNDKLGCFPLAICQAASYLRSNRMSLETYIHKYNDHVPSEEVLSEIESLPAELTHDNEMSIAQQAIFTTFDINFDSLKESNVSFLEILQYAALMDPEDTLCSELYAIYGKKNKEFDADKQRDFELQINATSLARFVTDNPGSNNNSNQNLDRFDLHRIIKMVILLKLNKSNQDAIKEIIKRLLSHFMAEGKKDNNFYYILNQIIHDEMFYKSMPLVDPQTIKAFHVAGCQYLEEGNIDSGIYFLGNALINSRKNTLVFLRDDIKKLLPDIQDKLIQTYRTKFSLYRINSKWLFTLLNNFEKSKDKKPGKDTEMVRALLAREKEFTATFMARNDKDSSKWRMYHNAILDLTEVIIDYYKTKRGLTDIDKKLLYETYFIAGRTYRQAAKGFSKRAQAIENCVDNYEGNGDDWSSEDTGLWVEADRFKGNAADCLKSAIKYFEKIIEEQEKLVGEARDWYIYLKGHIGLIQLSKDHNLNGLVKKPIIATARFILDNLNKADRLEEYYKNDLQHCRNLIDKHDQPTNHMVRNSGQKRNQNTLGNPSNPNSSNKKFNQH